VAGVTAGALILSGVAAASTGAVPGDPLYGVKRSEERAQLAFAGSDASRGKLYLEFARSRLAEAARVPVTAIAALLSDMDTETRQGVALLTAAAVTGDHSTLAGVTAFLQTQITDLTTLTRRVPPPDRDAVVGLSRDLLDKIKLRVEELGSALAHGCAVTGTDDLGPIPPVIC
jgi:hypothetical protein